MSAPDDQRARLCRDAADAIEAASDLRSRARTLAGFDAFIDRIIDVVDRRSAPGPSGYARVGAIDAFGRRVQAAAGRSCNFELVVTREKVGGNAALLAAALASMGAGVLYLGGAGARDEAETPHEIFEAFANSMEECLCLGEPGQTDALEFDDGKIMLGKPGALDALTWSRLLERAGGVRGLRRRISSAQALAFGNWTMHRALDEIWERLAREVLPAINEQDRPAMLFVDIADPARREDDEIAGAMRRLADLHRLIPVTLGVNRAEAARLGRTAGAGLDLPEDREPNGDQLQRAAQRLREALGFRAVVVHSHRRSAASEGDYSAAFDAPYTPRPVISTGAGDHFNAGFVLASALDLPLGQRLACASAVSGRYVRTARSPSREDLLDMLRGMPAPESA